MSRRARHEAEIGFGSDSFLDIIANIVGILIILIVVAGVRVGNAPLMDLAADEPEVEAVAPPVLPEQVEPEAGDFTGVGPHVLAADPDDAPKPVPPRTIYREAPPPEVDPKLLARVEELRRRLAIAERETGTGKSTGQALVASLDRTRKDLAAAERDVAEQERRARSVEADVETLATDLAESRNLIIALRREKEQTKRKTNVETIEHELTPVSRLVEARELHFRLAGNRIAPVPLDELLDRLKSQVERQRDWLVKFRAHQGVVGPIDGFELQYVVQRQQLSTIDRLRGSAGVVRIGLSRWELKPTEELRAENYEEAIASGSRFRRAIGFADPETTLTFWVYPDSYDIFRKIQKVAHENDFLVAGRPLPDGVPIAGSPDGSRSSGQ